MIKTTLGETNMKIPFFPCLKKWVGARTHKSAEKYGEVVVLFTSENTGVYLSGVLPEEIGVEGYDLISCYNTRLWVDSGPITISNA